MELVTLVMMTLMLSAQGPTTTETYAFDVEEPRKVFVPEALSINYVEGCTAFDNWGPEAGMQSCKVVYTNGCWASFWQPISDEVLSGEFDRSQMYDHSDFLNPATLNCY